jgi:hypothetical protein
MGLTHGVRPKLERPIAPNQCPQCPFEDNLRGKVNRHKVNKMPKFVSCKQFKIKSRRKKQNSAELFLDWLR